MSQYVTAPPETDTVHSGRVYYKHKGAFSSTYTSYEAFLLHESTRGAKRIELHSVGTLRASESTPAVRICLDPPVSCTSATDKKSKSAPAHKLVVSAGSAKHVFKLDSKEESKKWADMLDRISNGPPLDGHTYEFPVKVLVTKHAEALQLNGCYILKVTDTHALLYSSNGALPTKFQCPLEDVTKAHCCHDTNKQAMLIMNTSSSAPIGEGGFAFITQDAHAISNVINYRHSLLEPPLPPRNKTPSLMLEVNTSSSSRQLTSSHSLNDILDSPRSKGRGTDHAHNMQRAPSMDALSEAPLPPPRPTASFYSATDLLTAKQSPRHNIAFNRTNSPPVSAHSKTPMASMSPDRSLPPPVPSSPRPRTPRQTHSLDNSALSSSPELSPIAPRSAHRASLGIHARHKDSVGSQSPQRDSFDSPLSHSGGHMYPSKKASISSMTSSVFSSSIPSRSPQHQHSGDQEGDSLDASRFFSPPPAVPRYGNAHQHRRMEHSCSESSAAAQSPAQSSIQSNAAQFESLDCPRERLTSYPVEENDFETVDNWIKDKSSPSVASLPVVPPGTTVSSFASTSQALGRVEEEQYDYSKRGELSFCTAPATGGYLKLVA